MIFKDEPRSNDTRASTTDPVEAMQAAESTRPMGGLVQIDDASRGRERNGGKTALVLWGERLLAAEAEVFTDGLAAFSALRDAGHPDTVLVADSRRGACNSTRSRWVNTALGVKRSLNGNYYAIRFTN
ncbi:MAG: hypothetical protein IT475_13820 [Aquimonas sp.]|nr:hypothetical protein [Aquimonas sp.]